MGGWGGGLNPAGPWKTWKLWGWVSALRKFTLVGVLAAMSRLDLVNATFTALSEIGPEETAPPPPEPPPPAALAAACGFFSLITLAAAAPPSTTGTAMTASSSRAVRPRMRRRARTAQVTRMFSAV